MHSRVHQRVWKEGRNWPNSTSYCATQRISNVPLRFEVQQRFRFHTRRKRTLRLRWFAIGLVPGTRAISRSWGPSLEEDSSYPYLRRRVSVIGRPTSANHSPRGLEEARSGERFPIAQRS